MYRAYYVSIRPHEDKYDQVYHNLHAYEEMPGTAVNLGRFEDYAQ